MGFTANVKPTILPAISAADMMCWKVIFNNPSLNNNRIQWI
jgi:hypothetical protein